MDHSKHRPAIPGTTPSPGVMGRRNPYAGTGSGISSQEIVNPTAEDTTISKSSTAQDRVLAKMIANLPYDVRERVAAAINMTQHQAALARRDVELSHQEVVVLRAELKRKNDANESLMKKCENYRVKIESMEETLEDMKDGMESRQKLIVKNRKSVGRMACTNRMLIDSLDALQLKQPLAPAPTDPINSRPLSPSELVAKDEVQLKTVNAQEKEIQQQIPHTHQSNNSQSDQLRESLLRVSREHYKSVKQIEIMEQKMEELKTNLKASELRNRQLKLEIGELRSQQGVEESEKLIMGSIKDGLAFKTRSFGKIDERFKALMGRQALDPMEGIMLLRRLVAFLATTPSNLHLGDVCNHITSRDLARIFDVDLVCLFIIPPDNPKIFHKYTMRSKEPEIIHIDDSKSLAADVVKYRHIARLNSLIRVDAHNVSVDGCPGIVTKRILSIPLFDATQNKVIGAVHMLNKSQMSEIFTEVDELFGMIYADQAASIVSSCFIHARMVARASLLTSLLEASVGLYSVAPEPTTFNKHKSLAPAEVLFVMESVARESLKCIQCRAFITSESVGMAPGQLVTIDRAGGSGGGRHSVMRNAYALATQFVGDRLGLVGKALRLQHMVAGVGSSLDHEMNPEVDLDPSGLPMVTMPILSIDGNILACLQLVAGPGSPKFFGPEGATDQVDRISFQQAVQWLSHQISAPLSHLLGSIGKPVRRPTSTPSTFSRAGVSSIASFEAALSSSEGMAGGGRQRPHSGVPHDFESLSSADATQSSVEGQSRPNSRNKSRKAAARAVSTKEGKLKAPSSPTERPRSRESITEDIDDLFIEPDPVEVAMNKMVMEKARIEEQLLEANKATVEAKAVAERRYEELKAATDFFARENEAMDTTLSAMHQMQAELESQVVKLQQAVEDAQHETAAMDRRRREEVAASEAAHLDREVAAGRDLGDQIVGLKQEIGKKMDEIELHQKTVEELRKSVHELESAATTKTVAAQELQKVLALCKIERDNARKSNEQLNTQLHTATEALNEKDHIIQILQEQLLKLTNENLQSLEHGSPRLSSAASSDTPVASLASPVNHVAQIPSVSIKAQPSMDVKNGDDASVHSAVSGPNVGPPKTPPPKTPPPKDRKPSFPNASPTAVSPTGSDISRPSKVSFKDLDPLPSPNGGTENMSPSGGSVASDQWVEHVDADGHKYYISSLTGETAWERPGEEATVFSHEALAAARPMTAGDWLQHFDEHGNEYWVNQVSGESAWELPQDAAILQQVKTAGAPSASSSAGGSLAASAGGYTIEI